VVRDLEGFEGDEPDFRSWLMTIAHHRLVDEHRRRSRRPVESVAPEGGAAVLRGGDVEAEALEALEEERVRALLSGLSSDQRSVLLLRVLNDLTVEQVAAVLGKTPGAVKQLQRRGLAVVKRQLRRLSVTL